MINRFCKHDRLGDGEHMFNWMARRGHFPYVVTFNALIDGYGRAKTVDDGMEIFLRCLEEG